MHIKDYEMVRTLILQRDHYIERIHDCKDALSITISGRHQDDQLIQEVRPHVLTQLNIRLNKVEQQLTDLGVTF